jgi:hypothetical protein
MTEITDDCGRARVADEESKLMESLHTGIVCSEMYSIPQRYPEIPTPFRYPRRNERMHFTRSNQIYYCSMLLV